MIAYFKKENILFILLGLVCGFSLGFLLLGKGFLLSLFWGIFGACAGRLFSGIWANKQMEKYNALLFKQGDPGKFLEVFTPIVERTGENTIEYVDGCNKLAYAWEAKGDFEKAWSYIGALNPRKVKRDGMGGVAATYSNRVRVLLLQEKREEAKAALEELRLVSEAAMYQSAALGKSTENRIRLYESWLRILDGEPGDEEFLEIEIDRALNPINKSEVQLLLALSCENRGDQAAAEELRMDAMTTGAGLWTGEKARELLGVK